MENGKCKILWDFTVQTDHEIYGRKPDVTVVQQVKNFYQMIDFACPYNGRIDTKELEKKRTLPRFGTRVEKDMEIERQGYTTSDRCTKNNIHKVKKLVKGNRY